MSCLSESAVVELLAGALPVADVQEHLDACAACRRLVADVARGDDDARTEPDVGAGESAAFGRPLLLARGTLVGRYRVLDRVGVGAMGVVYAAQDPELQRTIALKLLHAARGDGASLLREAQALAQLAHDHVIRVYDVGSAHGRVFVAMELVDGGTLTAWLAAPHRTAEVLAVFARAGAGLAAAHRAGIVHRDFKPDNVLVGGDGRVLVTDFGLSQLVADPARADGAVAGTPAYMAPELFDGAAADPRSDQYSYCVALHESLYGARMRRGEPVRVPARGPRGAVPRRVRRALERGLADEPAARWPSMDALLAALAPPPRTLRIAAAIAAVAAAAALAAWWLARPAPGRGACSDEARSLAGLWDGGVRARVEAAFAASGKPYQGAAFRAAAPVLDQYAADLGAMHAEACRATRTAGEQSERELALRLDCLGERRAALRALVALFERGDPDAIQRASRAAHELAPVARCGDLARLVRRAPAPDDEPTRLAVARLAPQLAELAALRDTGHATDGRARAIALGPEIRALADRPLQAELWLVSAQLAENAADYPQAAIDYAAAAFAAEAGRDDRLAAEARVWRYALAVQMEAPKAETDEALTAARAALERLGDDADLASALAHARGMAAVDAGTPGPAVEQFRLALAAAQRAHTPMAVLDARVALASMLEMEGEHPEAKATCLSAVADADQMWGTVHPATADVLSNCGAVMLEQGELDQARELLERALAIRLAVLAPSHPDLGDSYYNLASLDVELGEKQRALDEYAHARQIFDGARGTTGTRAAMALAAMGDVERQLGQAAAAERDARAALDVFAALGKPDEPQAAAAHDTLGQLAIERGDARAALAAFQRSVALHEAAEGPTSPSLLYSLGGVGRAQLALGHRAEAAATLRRAASLPVGDPADVALAVIRFALAQALGGTAEARALAVQARAVLAARSDGAQDVVEIDAWFAKHGH